VLSNISSLPNVITARVRNSDFQLTDGAGLGPPNVLHAKFRLQNEYGRFRGSDLDFPIALSARLLRPCAGLDIRFCPNLVVDHDNSQCEHPTVGQSGAGHIYIWFDTSESFDAKTSRVDIEIYPLAAAGDQILSVVFPCSIKVGASFEGGDTEGKIHRVDPDFWSILTVSNRDSQSNFCVKWKITGQPCEFQVPAWKRGALARSMP
jgi:hypothetical protein